MAGAKGLDCLAAAPSVPWPAEVGGAAHARSPAPDAPDGGPEPQRPHTRAVDAAASAEDHAEFQAWLHMAVKEQPVYPAHPTLMDAAAAYAARGVGGHACVLLYILEFCIKL